nr:hypothetical protein [Mesonia sp. HuA40]
MKDLLKPRVLAGLKYVLDVPRIVLLLLNKLPQKLNHSWGNLNQWCF